MATKQEKIKTKEEVKEQISFNIRKYRKERNITQEKLADNADISYDFMRRIESSSGKCGFSIYTIYKISLALDVTIDELLSSGKVDK